MARVHTWGLCVVCLNTGAIVATLTIVPNGPILYSGSLKSKPPVSMCDEKVIRVICYAVSRVRPALCVPIVMIINLLALSPEHSEVAFGEPESHYHTLTQDQ
ncbi:hypothetical protein Q8A73_009949 [Channa argus]|nr:hypothetical protein Q8A73_009949 [Channa argus]